MGTGASKNPVNGAPANPRVVYTDRRAKQEQKNLRIDAPVLMDVQHGSIRYRFNSEANEPADKIKRVEHPYDGEEKVQKRDYFYHARLSDFSQDASPAKENNWKFYYVSKAPTSAHQKKVFYVFGKGNMQATDGEITKPSVVRDEKKDFAWPSEYKRSNPTDAYYELSFPQGVEAAVTEETDQDFILADLASTADKSLINLVLKESDNTDDIKKRLAIKILKAAGSIHIFFERQELRNEMVIVDLRAEDNRESTMFKITLRLI